MIISSSFICFMFPSLNQSRINGNDVLFLKRSVASPCNLCCLNCTWCYMMTYIDVHLGWADPFSQSAVDYFWLLSWIGRWSSHLTYKKCNLNSTGEFLDSTNIFLLQSWRISEIFYLTYYDKYPHNWCLKSAIVEFAASWSFYLFFAT